jgi:dihydroorotase
LAPGSPGDVTILDPDQAWTVDRGVFLSKSHNTPFHGRELKGRAVFTIVGGTVVWQADA